MHPLGLDWGAAKTSCQTCFWSKKAGPGPKVLRCVPSGMKRIQGEWRGCSFWQIELDCLDCGACCGPAFDAVEVSQRDPVRKKHPTFLWKHEGRLGIRRRKGNYCMALAEDNRCRIYVDRPRCCREFEKGSGNCLFARQRLELSPIWIQKEDDRL